MLEKRKNIRRFAAMNVACFYPDGQNAGDKCTLVNISKGGVGIKSAAIFNAGQRIKIVFSHPQGGEVSAFAEILYSQDGNSGSFSGAKYCDIDGAKCASLNNYLLKYFNLY